MGQVMFKFMQQVMDCVSNHSRRQLGNLGCFNSLFDGGNFYVHNVATIGTTEESLFTGEMDPGTGAAETKGMVMFKNLDTTNYVEIGPEPASYSIKLLAGESAGPMPWSGDGLYAKANTAAVLLEYAFIDQD